MKTFTVREFAKFCMKVAWRAPLLYLGRARTAQRLPPHFLCARLSHLETTMQKKHFRHSFPTLAQKMQHFIEQLDYFRRNE